MTYSLYILFEMKQEMEVRISYLNIFIRYESGSEYAHAFRHLL